LPSRPLDPIVVVGPVQERMRRSFNSSSYILGRGTQQGGTLKNVVIPSPISGEVLYADPLGARNPYSSLIAGAIRRSAYPSAPSRDLWAWPINFFASLSYIPHSGRVLFRPALSLSGGGGRRRAADFFTWFSETACASDRGRFASPSRRRWQPQVRVLFCAPYPSHLFLAV
jgi:hypothetical protein